MDKRRFEELLDAYLNRSVSSADSSELEGMLRARPSLRSVLVRRAVMEAQLHKVLASEIKGEGTSGFSRRAREWLPAAAAAALLLAIVAWIVFQRPVGVEPPGPGSAAPTAPPPVVEILDGPLPGAVQGFRGHLVGHLVSVDASALILEVSRVVPHGASRAVDPGLLRGRHLRMRFIRTGWPGANYEKILSLARRLHDSGEQVTAAAFAEREMYLTDLRKGDQTGPDPR